MPLEVVGWTISLPSPEQQVTVIPMLFDNVALHAALQGSVTTHSPPC